MGVCVEVLHEACAKKIDELAVIIEGELKAEAAKGSPTGRGKYATGLAVGAIHIESMGEFKKFVGGTDGTGTGKTGTDHLAMINGGNGGGRIYPKHGSLLHLQSPGLDAYAKSVKGYGGSNFVHKVAMRHGG